MDCQPKEPIKEFLNSYSFKDTEEVYTNGSELIQVFRVEQMLDMHLPQWIPCSERLPSYDEYVENGGRFILDDGNRRHQGLFDIRDRKFKFSKHISGLHYELFDDEGVIAWMPLPGPYKEGAEE